MPKGQVAIEQDELPNMPPSSPIGKAARALLAIRDEIDETFERLEEKHDNAKKKLLELMAGDNRDAIVVDGVTFRHVHKDAYDEIRVLVKKGKKEKDE